MSEDQDICLRCWAAGQVQGVWYRAFTRQEAERRGLTGYAKNLSDGRVEVLACGPKTAVDELVKELRRGPPAAHVSDLKTEVVHNCPTHQGFRTM